VAAAGTRGLPLSSLHVPQGGTTRWRCGLFISQMRELSSSRFEPGAMVP